MLEAEGIIHYSALSYLVHVGHVAKMVIDMGSGVTSGIMSQKQEDKYSWESLEAKYLQLYDWCVLE